MLFGSWQTRSSLRSSVPELCASTALTGTIRGPRWIGEATRAKMVYYTLGHTQDIYGQMAVYLRLNGLVPPASRRGGV